MRTTEKNARARGIPFALELPYMESMVDASGARCAISNIRFSLEHRRDDKKGSRRPWVPSIDRIDNAQGYVAGNVRLVCAIVNIAMNTWGEAPLLVLVGAMNGKFDAWISQVDQ